MGYVWTVDDARVVRRKQISGFAVFAEFFTGKFNQLKIKSIKNYLFV